MRTNQYTLRPQTVHAYAKHLLQVELELRDYKGAVPASVLASVLLFATVWHTSLTAACHSLAEAPSAESVRKALHACLPSRPRDLLKRLLSALRRTLPDHLRSRPLPLALDVHRRPYYGKATRGTSRGQKKKSTKNAFSYATLVALSPEGRYTIGLLPVRPFMRHTTMLTELLGQAQEAGIQVSYLMADKEFYSAEVIAWLQKNKVPFIIPAQRKGSKGTGNSYLFESTTPVGWYVYSWTTHLRRYDFKTGKRHKRSLLSVTVDVCVARHRQEKDKTLVFACWGISKWAPAHVVEQYRKRFGIEVSYRQLGECLAKTNSRNERVRLLLLGLALLMCNLWSWLHCEVFSTGALGERCLDLAEFPLQQLKIALAEAIKTSFGGVITEWRTQRPLPSILALFQCAD